MTLLQIIAGIGLAILTKQGIWFFVGLSLAQGFIIGKLLLYHLEEEKKCHYKM
jgi:hypothetical protein